jgi:iron complex outermembrane receptor protein
MRRIQAYSRRLMLAGSAGAVALLGGHAAFAADTTNSGTRVEEVVVTVQKRSELLSKVPQSVSVVSQDSLNKIQATDFEDYAKLIPGLSLQSDTPGITRISLRGVNTGGVASTVAVYLDELPFGSSSGLANGSILAGDFDTWDVSRIEVLRGPQGTLYGASSLGGVLKFVTNAPSHEREMRAEGTMESVDGGDMGYSLKAMINLPAGDKFALRASAFYKHDGGWIDSIGVNPVANIFGPLIGLPNGPNVSNGTEVAKNINDSTTYGGRISALFTPTDNLSIRLTATSQNIRSENANTVIADPTTLDQR